MSLRIAFDLDGTLADLDSALDRIAGELFPSERRDETNPAEAGFHEAPAPGETPVLRPDAPTGGTPVLRPDASTGGTPVLRPDASTGGTPVLQKAGETIPAKSGSEPEGKELTPEEEQLEPPELRALTRRQQHQIWDAVRGTVNFWETLGETEPGIVARIAAIADERRWEVIFITQRPAADGDTTQRQSQHWLATHGFEMPSVFVLGAGASRGKVATALSLDVVVDDRPENCLDVKVDSHARAFLVSRQPGAQVGVNARRLGIEVVQSIGECLDILTAVPKQRTGLMRRLKKAFSGSGPV
jgi:hypothetical protein